MSKKAFIIDDEESLRDVITELLSIWEIETVEAEDAEQALHYATQQKTNFDLIFIDVNLPKMNGKELYQQLISYFPQAHYIFMSGFEQNHNLIDLPENGNFVYLKKPFRVMELKNIIDQLLNT